MQPTGPATGATFSPRQRATGVKETEVCRSPIADQQRACFTPSAEPPKMAGRLMPPSERELKGDLPRQLSLWVYKPKDYASEPESPSPGVERPSPLAFEPKILFRASERPSSGRERPSPLAFGPIDHIPAPESSSVEAERPSPPALRAKYFSRMSKNPSSGKRVVVVAGLCAERPPPSAGVVSRRRVAVVAAGSCAAIHPFKFDRGVILAARARAS